MEETKTQTLNRTEMVKENLKRSYKEEKRRGKDKVRLGAQGSTYTRLEGVLKQHRDLQQPNEVPDCLNIAGQSQAWAEVQC